MIIGGRRHCDWLQLLVLLLTLCGIAVHAESRLARIEQQLLDADRDRADLLQRLDRIERRLLRPPPDGDP